MNNFSSDLLQQFDRDETPDGVVIRYGRSTGRVAPGDLDLLSSEERGRVAAFRDPLRSVHFATAHAGVRRCLAGILGCDPAEIRFGRHPCAGCGRARHGRPYIDRPCTRWEFSLSRSGPHWVCAAAEGVRVGVDLERVRPMDVSSLAPGVLSAGERRHLGEVPPEFRPAEFLRCWTRKEAVVKASGIGIEAELGAIDVTPGQACAEVNHKVPGCEFGTWSVTDLPARADLISAIAVPARS
ncbi:4'-phosphopantetheinyl transferase superfamily protein [Streptomyces sp. NPDC088135]|uniref:4'-phosphopantetheinyl transferase family protein n=1 Tax=Streptomyces sp. NPDC088135 TaxID=3160993 RepID=UPI003445779A